MERSIKDIEKYYKKSLCKEILNPAITGNIFNFESFIYANIGAVAEKYFTEYNFRALSTNKFKEKVRLTNNLEYYLNLNCYFRTNLFKNWQDDNLIMVTEPDFDYGLNLRFYKEKYSYDVICSNLEFMSKNENGKWFISYTLEQVAELAEKYGIYPKNEFVKLFKE